MTTQDLNKLYSSVMDKYATIRGFDNWGHFMDKLEIENRDFHRVQMMTEYIEQLESQLLSPKVVIGYSDRELRAIISSIEDIKRKADSDVWDIINNLKKPRTLDIEKILREYIINNDTQTDQELCELEKFVNHLKEKIK